MTATATAPSPRSWRDQYPVHPCADVFPMMTDAELEELAKDIAAHGLQSPITVWEDESNRRFVLDGRNRLEALTRLGIRITTDLTSTIAIPADTTPKAIFHWSRMLDPAAYVISQNIHRRHLTKEERAELIVKAVEAGQSRNDRAKSARSFSPTARRKGGSTKDPVLEQAVTQAKKHGISKRTVQNARAKLKGKTPKVGVSSRPPARAVDPVRAPKPKLDVVTFKRELFPILKGLKAEGRKNMATMSPGTVAHLTFQLEQLLDRLDASATH